MTQDSARLSSFEEKYDAYGSSVYRLAMVYLGRHADAEDVTQEAFLRLLTRAPAFADGEHERRWLLQVTANLCRDQLRGFWRRRVTALEEDCPVRSREDFELLDAVVRLPEKYKLPIHLHYYEGYSVLEVAHILDLGLSAVKMRLKRGRELLKLELEGLD
ncbi:MAG: sigma-70 family RNA polymerase sigma factor [Lawsonibacter sp.]|nr:sigma-70 family RNA polymerase sigma factor [Lawsonibacter sp.]